MEVPKTGRVWARGTLLNSNVPPEAVITAKFDGSPVAMVREGGEVRVLVAGPQATGNPAGTLVLPVMDSTGVAHATVRVVMGDEDIPIRWGPFRLID